MQYFPARPWVPATVALAGAGLIAVTPVTAPLPGAYVADIQLAAGGDIVLNFVRHGESTDNVDLIAGTTPPGAPLTELGQQQAQDIGNELFNQYGLGGVDGIFAGELLRMQETAAPFAELAQLDVTYLSGLNEINAGIFEGVQSESQTAFQITGLLMLAAPFLWTYGLYSVPLVGSSDYNGMVFNDRFGEAVQAIYDAGGTNDVSVAFSSAGATMIWTMMNVNNPDPMLILQHPLANTSQVVIEGNPTDGWTLVSWDGIPVPAADLQTDLFVAWRDLMVAPQVAALQIQNALTTFDPTTITNAIQTGFNGVLAAIVQYPQSVIGHILDALQGEAAAVGDQFSGYAGEMAGGMAADALASI